MIIMLTYLWFAQFDIVLSLRKCQRWLSFYIFRNRKIEASPSISQSTAGIGTWLDSFLNLHSEYWSDRLKRKYNRVDYIIQFLLKFIGFLFVVSYQDNYLGSFYLFDISWIYNTTHGEWHETIVWGPNWHIYKKCLFC